MTNCYNLYPSFTGMIWRLQKYNVPLYLDTCRQLDILLPSRVRCSPFLRTSQLALAYSMGVQTEYHHLMCRDSLFNYRSDGIASFESFADKLAFLLAEAKGVPAHLSAFACPLVFIQPSRSTYHEFHPTSVHKFKPLLFNSGVTRTPKSLQA